MMRLRHAGGWRAIRHRHALTVDQKAAFAGLSVSPSTLVGKAAPNWQHRTKHGEIAMKRYIIEREIPGIGGMTGPQLEQAAAKSNDALAKLGGKAQWIHSYVADNKTFCVYLAENE